MQNMYLLKNATFKKSDPEPRSLKVNVPSKYLPVYVFLLLNKIVGFLSVQNNI